MYYRSVVVYVGCSVLVVRIAWLFSFFQYCPLSPSVYMPYKVVRVPFTLHHTAQTTDTLLVFSAVPLKPIANRIPTQRQRLIKLLSHTPCDLQLKAGTGKFELRTKVTRVC